MRSKSCTHGLETPSVAQYGSLKRSSSIVFRGREQSRLTIFSELISVYIELVDYYHYQWAILIIKRQTHHRTCARKCLVGIVEFATTIEIG